MPTDCYLCLQEVSPNSANTCIGRFVLRDLTFEPAWTCLKIDLEFLQDENPRLSSERAPRWIDLRATISTNQQSRHQIGSIDLSHLERPTFRGVTGTIKTQVSWHWRLTEDDVERLERARAQSPGAPLSLQMEVQGIVEIADGVFGVNSPSGGQLQIEPSQWDRLCAALGYTIGPSGLLAMSDAGLDAPSWREATVRLEEASGVSRIQ